MDQGVNVTPPASRDSGPARIEGLGAVPSLAAMTGPAPDGRPGASTDSDAPGPTVPPALRCAYCGAPPPTPDDPDDEWWTLRRLVEPFHWLKPSLAHLEREPWAYVMVRPGSYVACPECSALLDARHLGELLHRRPAGTARGHDDAAFLLALVDRLTPPVPLMWEWRA